MKIVRMVTSAAVVPRPRFAKSSARHGTGVGIMIPAGDQRVLRVLTRVELVVLAGCFNDRCQF